MTGSLTVKIGADPEFFLKHRRSGKIVSAHDLVPGTKVKPHPLKNGGFIQADGTAVEFNIQPAKTGGEFASNIKTAIEDIKEFVDFKKFSFVFKPSVQYDKEYFDTIPDEAKALGCDPDFNAYTMEQNKVYVPPEGVRTGSGHLHIGFCEDQDVKNPDYFATCALLVKHLDASLATREHKWCDDTIRPTLYGDIGNFRPKPYGVEYRTLGNAWLNFSEAKLIALFNDTKNTVDGLYKYKNNARINMPRSVIKVLNSKNKIDHKYFNEYAYKYPNIYMINQL